MAGLSVEASAQYTPRIFSQRIPLCEVVPFTQVTDRLELTQQNIPLEDISYPLVNSVRKSHWFSIENGRIYIEVKSNAFRGEVRRRFQAIRGVDFDDCLVSATSWHNREFRLMEQFGVELHIAGNIYEMSKILVPGKAIGEGRYTPRLNMALLTTYVDLLNRGIPTNRAFEETSDWREAVSNLIQEKGEVVVKRQAVDPKISELFLRNRISRFLYQDFADAVFDPRGPAALRFIATRGKIEGPLGQVYKIHTSGVLRRSVDMVIYTNDIKAETLIYLGNLLPDQVKRKTIYLFDDNIDEVVPYLKTASDRGIDNIWVVQVSHPDSKRKDSRIDLEPARIIGRGSNGETVLRYYTIKPNLRLSRSFIFQE